MPLALIVLLGAALRVFELGTRSWWLDEAVTVHLLRMPFGDMLATVPDSEGAPPLYYVLAWGWTQVFGLGEAGLRSLSVVFGVLAIPVVYLCAKRIGGERAGLIAALVAAVSPQLIWHAQDGRVYALFLLFCAVSLLCTLRALERPTGGRLAVWALVGALAAATHYFAAFLVIGELIWLLVALPEARRRVLAAGAAVGVAGLALVPIALDQSGHAGNFLASLPLGRRLLQVPVESVVGYQPPAQLVVAALGALVGALALLSAWRGRADPERATELRWLAGIGTACLVVPLVLLPVADWFTTRNLLPAWPPLVVVLAVLVARDRSALGRVAVGAFAALAIVVTLVSADRSKFDHDDWRPAFAALGAPPAEGRAVVMNPQLGIVVFEAYVRGSERVPNDASPVRVKEIDVVVLPGPFRELGERPKPPRYPIEAPPGFREVERRDTPTFRVVRFAAPRAVEVPVATLDRLAPSPDARPGRVVQGAAARALAPAASP